MSGILCFQQEIALKTNVAASVIYECIWNWLKTNIINHPDTSIRDGKVWMYCTVEGFVQYLPFFRPRQVRHGLEKLKKSGLIITANYNKAGYDRTVWYSIPTFKVPENLQHLGYDSFDKNVKSIRQNCHTYTNKLNNNITNTNTNGQISQNPTSDQKAVSDKTSRTEPIAIGWDKAETTPVPLPAEFTALEKKVKELTKRAIEKNFTEIKPPKTRSKNAQYTDDFEEFWEECAKLYHNHKLGKQKRGTKQHAATAFNKIDECNVKSNADYILHAGNYVIGENGLEDRFKHDTQWEQGIGIPHVSTFINKHMWEDDMCTAEQGGGKREEDPNAKYANIIPSDQR